MHCFLLFANGDVVCIIAIVCSDDDSLILPSLSTLFYELKVQYSALPPLCLSVCLSVSLSFPPSLPLSFFRHYEIIERQGIRAKLLCSTLHVSITNPSNREMHGVIRHFVKYPVHVIQVYL